MERVNPHIYLELLWDMRTDQTTLRRLINLSQKSNFPDMVHDLDQETKGV